MDLLKAILYELPYKASYNNFAFSPVLFINHSEEIRLGYIMPEVSSGWKNPFLDNRQCDFLILFENINCDSDLEYAIRKTKEFFIKHPEIYTFYNQKP